VGVGVDETWRRSNQFHWFVRCSHCRHYSYIDFDRDTQVSPAPHYVDLQRRIYACGKCHNEIYDADRIRGEWVAKYKDRDEIHGYWFSQMMAPWFPASRIVSQFETKSPEYFNNFVLGKAYTPQDMSVSRQTILNACAPSIITPVGVSIGVDQKASELQWVAMTHAGIFAHGRAKSWEEIEHMKLMWQAVVVADGRPYAAGPKMMADKYDDFYIALGKSMDNSVDTLEWKRQVVYYSNVKLMDLVVKEISDGRLLIRERPYQLEDYIAEWGNIYRTTVEEPDGRIKSAWLKKEGKEIDFPMATCYARIGLTKVLSGTATSKVIGDEPEYGDAHTVENGKMTVDFSGQIESAMNGD